MLTCTHVFQALSYHNVLTHLTICTSSRAHVFVTCTPKRRHVYTNSRRAVLDMDPSVVMEVVILAEFMVLPSLISACQMELARYVDGDNAAHLLRFANRYNLHKLENLCFEIMP